LPLITSQYEFNQKFHLDPPEHQNAFQGSNEIESLEGQIIPLAFGSDVDFNQEFARTYSKMLEIGTDSSQLIDYL